MGNTQRELKKRLLHLFPVKTLKEHFGQTGGAEDIIETLSTKPLDELVSFTSVFYKLTRQNIYLFDLDTNFKRSTIGDDFPLEVLSESKIGDEYTFCCLPKTVFSVYLSDPMDKEDLAFYQPVILRFIKKRLIVHFTKLEKNITSYYPLNRDARKAKITNSHDEILKVIINHLKSFYDIENTDFNKGIKDLWEKDIIDCHKIQSNNKHSVRVETMNGTLTYKEKYPDEYENVILTPIASAQWKYLEANDDLCEGFTADPSQGVISITKFPKHINQVSNVIDKILASN